MHLDLFGKETEIRSLRARQHEVHRQTEFDKSDRQIHHGSFGPAAAEVRNENRNVVFHVTEAGIFSVAFFRISRLKPKYSIAQPMKNWTACAMRAAHAAPIRPCPGTRNQEITAAMTTIAPNQPTCTR